MLSFKLKKQTSKNVAVFDVRSSHATLTVFGICDQNMSDFFSHGQPGLGFLQCGRPINIAVQYCAIDLFFRRNYCFSYLDHIKRKNENSSTIMQKIWRTVVQPLRFRAERCFFQWSFTEGWPQQFWSEAKEPTPCLTKIFFMDTSDVYVNNFKLGTLITREEGSCFHRLTVNSTVIYTNAWSEPQQTFSCMTWRRAWGE